MTDSNRPDWFVTHCGRVCHVLDPKPEDIDILDIAHGLSMLCRFGGHVTEFYSVAQHSVHVSELVPPALQLAALLHDATEAYIGDIIRPLKREIVSVYGPIEERWETVIQERFGVVLGDPEIKRADMIALATERKAFVPNAQRLAAAGTHRFIEDELGVSPDTSADMTPLTPEYARALFMSRFFFVGGRV